MRQGKFSFSLGKIFMSVERHFADITVLQRRKEISKRKKKLAKQKHQHNAKVISEMDGASFSIKRKGKTTVTGLMDSEASGVKIVK